MSDLHAAIAAALDCEQALAEEALTTVDEQLLPLVPPTPWHNPDVIWRGLRTSWARAVHIAAQDPARTLRRVEADRRVLARHDVVRHTCDVPACVRPDHLLTGTHADNVQDMVARGRQWWGGSPKAARI